MLRSLSLCVVVVLAASTAARAAEISGSYLETRTCDVYTGPCFANSQVGLTGQQAILAWSIDEGRYQGVDLTGLKVVMTVRAADTLGFGSGVVIHPDPIRSVILVDEQATPEQRDALAAFARERTARWPARWCGSPRRRSPWPLITSTCKRSSRRVKRFKSRRASLARRTAYARTSGHSIRR